MKRTIRAGIVLSLVCALLCGCGTSVPVLRTITLSGSQTVYEAIYENGSTARIEPFEPAAVTTYFAEDADYETDIVDGKIVNSLQATELTDAYGNAIAADDTLTALLQAVADTVDHDFYDLKILTDDRHYFVFLKLNVNWQSPCILYEYDTESGVLHRLCEWDDAELRGIALTQA